LGAQSFLRAGFWASTLCLITFTQPQLAT
jgi:hypothetical protein